MTTALPLFWNMCAVGAGLFVIALSLTAAAYVAYGLWSTLERVRVFILAFREAGKRR